MFCADDGGKIELAEYREHFSKFLEECGIENPVTEVDGVSHHKYTPHSARHTFASLMKKVSGADKDKLALIGHTSTEIPRNDQDADVQSLRKITGAISFRLLPIPFSSLKNAASVGEPKRRAAVATLGRLSILLPVLF